MNRSKEVITRKAAHEEECQSCFYHYCRQGECENCLNKHATPQAENEQEVCCCYDILDKDEVLPFCNRHKKIKNERQDF